MELITQYWQQLIALTALGAWLVRIEANQRSHAKEIKRLDGERSKDLKAAEDSRKETNAKLDRMDDKMERNFSEIRSDIKELIRQGASQ